MSNFIKIPPVGAEVFHVEGRTDRHDEASNRFWAILRTRLKMILNIYSEDRENSSYAVRAVYSNSKEPQCRKTEQTKNLLAGMTQQQSDKRNAPTASYVIT